jgi:hypothetical protein
MSKKNQLVLAALPFASINFQDVFVNLTEKEIEEIKPEWKEYIGEALEIITSDDEVVSGSKAHLYEAFRKRFPIGSKQGELALLQLIATFARELYGKISENPLDALLVALEQGHDEDCGNENCPIHGTPELADGQDAAVLGDS